MHMNLVFPMKRNMCLWQDRMEEKEDVRLGAGTRIDNVTCFLYNAEQEVPDERK